MPIPHNAGPLLREAIETVLSSVPDGECMADGISERQAARIELHVARKLFGRPFRGSRELEAFLDGGDHSERSRRRCVLSEATLPLYGIGEDSFFLNEHLAEGVTLPHFTTIREWDEADHLAQEAAWEEEGDRPDGRKPYEGRLLWSWGRWLDNGRLVYGNLSVALPYVEGQLDGYAGDLARERFPTEFVEGPLHGEKSGNLFRWDMVETPRDLAALRGASERVAAKVIESWKGELNARIGASGAWLSRSRKEDDSEINEDLVFSSPEAMGMARFRTWLKDLDVIPDGTAVLERTLDEFKARLKSEMEKVFDAVATAQETLEGEDRLSARIVAETAMEELFPKPDQGVVTVSP